MSEKNDGGPAFPCDHLVDGDEGVGLAPGMTLRQYAAIKLRVPDSGTDWLDEMIRQSLRQEPTGKAKPQDLGWPATVLRERAKP